MTNIINSPTVKSICIETAEKLFSLVKLSNDKSDNANLTDYENVPMLVFPVKRENSGLRVSEQEARVIFCQSLEARKYFYSIEVPTEKKYSFAEANKKVITDENSKDGQAALSDLCIYGHDLNNTENRINVEFKAHNVSIGQIEKDFLKLISEPYDGLFFHLLESVNSGTLTTNTTADTARKGILVKYHKCIEKLLRKRIEFEDKTFYFAVCSMEPQFLLWQEIKGEDLLNAYNKNIDFEKSPFFINYSIKNRSIDYNKESSKWERLIPKTNDNRREYYK